MFNASWKNAQFYRHHGNINDVTDVDTVENVGKISLNRTMFDSFVCTALAGVPSGWPNYDVPQAHRPIAWDRQVQQVL